jgi:SAM-dependent methyltransferase
VTGYDADAFDAYEAAGWGGKDASAYDALAGRVTARFADPLLDAVAAGPGTRLIDVATGPGYVAARAAARGATAVGVDRSETMLGFARAHTAGVEFVAGDATALPFDDASFDAYVAAFVLLHLGRPERAAAEAARVLASGGRIAYAVWDEPSRGRWLGVLLEAVAQAGATAPAGLPDGPPLFRFADEDELSRLLGEAGFVDVTVERHGFDLELDSADELWEGLVDGTVRVGPLVRTQPEETQRAIRECFDELLGAYEVEAGLAVPVAATIGVGTLP